MQRNIGILGGSFNPIHMGHLILAQDALERFELDQVLFIPCATPPHKSAHVLADASHRLAMLENAIVGDPRFEVSRIELDRPGVSYTVDTVRQMREEDPEIKIWFIIGADTLPELHTWKDIYELLDMCEFITFHRPGIQGTRLTLDGLGLDAPWPEHLLKQIMECHSIEISSSEIRARVAEAMSIRYLVPESVEMYIHEHSLYKS